MFVPVPREGAGRVPGPARGVRARAQGRVGRARARAVPGRRPPRRGGRRTACGGSSRPGSASGARCSTTCSSASCRSTPERVEAALDACGIDRDRRPADRRGGGVDRARRGARRPSPTRDERCRPTDADRAASQPVVRLAPAKVNLTLAVLGTRPDGFHDLHSVMVPLDLADRLSVAVLPTGGADSLHVTGFDPGPLADNLVLRAIAAARGAARPAWGRPEPPAAARGPARQADPGRRRARGRLVRRRRGRRRRARGVGRDARRRAARAPAARRRLGSDVPFFLAGGPALVEGRGERVTPLRLAAGRRRPGAHDRPGPAARHARRAGSRRPPRSRPGTTARGSPAAPRASRRSHLAEELRKGLPGRSTSWPGPRCSPPPTTSRPRRRSSSPASCRSSGRCCGCSAGRSACPAPARPTGRSILRIAEAAAAADARPRGGRRRRAARARAAGAVRRRGPHPVRRPPADTTRGSA